jgi:hypothetical protein
MTKTATHTRLAARPLFASFGVTLGPEYDTHPLNPFQHFDPVMGLLTRPGRGPGLLTEIPSEADCRTLVDLGGASVAVLGRLLRTPSKVEFLRVDDLLEIEFRPDSMREVFPLLRYWSCLALWAGANIDDGQLVVPDGLEPWTPDDTARTTPVVSEPPVASPEPEQETFPHKLTRPVTTVARRTP